MDTPTTPQPTQPDRLTALLAETRTLIDAYEAALARFRAAPLLPYRQTPAYRERMARYQEYAAMILQGGE